eukprot:CAMPEP_0170502596 /NCGR_PEP_ID=MMETSP0208-20121228/41973_1 /TAXON_ID=197538 /ORGANISM="Strombidium inclinatum, Strain S3" /LENGTH=131 /DNA_ID=CAMNT_0010781751 /DNA_START=4336 /DNA_END=4731 /DNA_ORIENTATION=+
MLEEVKVVEFVPHPTSIVIEVTLVSEPKVHSALNVDESREVTGIPISPLALIETPDGGAGRVQLETEEQLKLGPNKESAVSTIIGLEAAVSKLKVWLGLEIVYEHAAHISSIYAGQGSPVDRPPFSQPTQA